MQTQTSVRRQLCLCQVLMDVLGVAITCVVCNMILHPAMRASRLDSMNAALLPSEVMLNATTA